MDTREEALIAHPAVEMPLQDCRPCFFFPIYTCICGCGGLMCACGARWTLSWVRECGLFCRRHLGLHMVQQTVVREAGGHVGGHPYCGFSQIYSIVHRHKWQNKRLGNNWTTQMLLCHHKHGAHPPLWMQWCISVKREVVSALFDQCIAQGQLKDENLTVTLMINGLPPEVHLPIMWICHHFITTAYIVVRVHYSKPNRETIREERHGK